MPRCRCHSRKQEKRCCGPFHAGQPATSPAALMRSRYAAYAKGLTDYIMVTTDREGPHWRNDSDEWNAEIEAFCHQTKFEGLTILDAPPPKGNSATVTFHAALSRNGQDASFTEKSLFREFNGRWYYVKGV